MSRLPRAAAEAIGTFFLVFIGPGSAMVNAYTGGVVGHAHTWLNFGMTAPASQSTIQCPAFLVRTVVTMLTDACVFFWDSRPAAR